MATQAAAWEFSMKGDWEWRYRYWTRTGNSDIFGRMDDTHVNLGINHLVVFPTGATTNRINSGNFGGGVLAGENNYGADMSLNDNRMTIFPKIKVNPAISVEASMNLTSLGIWSNGRPYEEGVPYGWVNDLYVPINDRPVAIHVPNTFVTVQWLKASIRTPMLDFSLGYKTSAIGMGLWKHKCNRASASFSVSTHYGPFKIGFSPYFARERSAWDTTRITGAGSTRRKDDRRDYFRAIMGEIVYRSGPMEIQLVSDSYHQPNSSRVTARGAGLPDPFSRPDEDILRYRIALAMKYFDGRVFFNGEADWFNRWRSGRGSADPATNVPPFRDREGRDNDGWLYGVEFGALGGPSKVTLNYVRATGDDPATRKTSDDAADSESGITSCYMKPWGYLMYYMYGAGDGWDAAGYGQPTNFHHAGVRIDYAVASNLNVNLVYSRAWRDQPNAYRLGGDYRIRASAFTNDDIRTAQGINPDPQARYPGHAVPDHARDIGWEADLGVDWKLLEGLTWSTTFAYWKPGNWWSYAYPNTAHLYYIGTAPNNNTNDADGEARATFGLGREIDGLFSVETKLLINF
jgi:hypothetical protein